MASAEHEQRVIEHLKMIEGVIDRLARNSFAVKATAYALTTAIVAVMVTQDEPWVGLGGILLLFMWVLDAAYFIREKEYRCLFNYVRRHPPPELCSSGFFSMKPKKYGRCARVGVFFSWSQVLYHLPMLLLVAGAGLFMTYG